MESTASHSVSSGGAVDRRVVIGIGLTLLAYAVGTWSGWIGHVEAPTTDGQKIAHAWAVLPFVLLLGAIAVFPLLARTSHWWDSNLHKLQVACGLAVITLIYLAYVHPNGSSEQAEKILAHTMFADYVPFIVLLFSLFAISGGIRIVGDLPAHAATNSLFLVVGGILASLIGTTGAAMVLVRALLQTNRERKHVAHTLVFFIFVVCNCGGLLLPLGDPPLFLGYLRGVPFLWTLSLWKSWLSVNGLLIGVYFLWDHFVCYPRETVRDIVRDEAHVHRLRFHGLWPNAFLLGGVILSVALLDPGQAFPGTQWHPWLYLREAVQLALVALSLLLGSSHDRVANGFSYGAIIEVACLFLGIFICMQPALEILKVRGASLGLTTPRAFFWASGSLSSVLDNAPTYVVFFEAALDLPGARPSASGMMLPDEALLTGVSLGSVMMGAMTYIGNGPNFMVKTIAEKSGVNMPSFFGYLLYSFGVLLPILALDTWLWL